MDARVVQEAAGPGRFIVGFGTSKIFLNNTKQGGPPKVTKPLAHMRDSVEIVRGILGGERFEYDGKVFSADIPALSDEAHVAALGRAGVRRRYRADDAADRRRDRRRAPDAVDHDARLRALHGRQHPRGRGEVRAAIPATSTSAARSSPRSTRPTARPAATAPARSAACTSRTRCRTSRARPTCSLESAGIEQDEIIPVAEAMESGGRLAAKALRHRRAARQVQADRRHAVGLHRGDRGVPRRRLHAHHARALGRGPARADPPLRREGAAALPGRMSMAVADHRRPGAARRDRGPDDRRLELHGRRAGHGRADGRALPGARPPASSGSRSRTAAPTRSAPGAVPAAARR